MKALYERWTAISLPKRILGGMIIGAVLGMVIPQAVGISILGNLFVNALKGIAPLLVFFLVISSLCQAKQMPRRHHPHRYLPLPVQHTARRCDRGRRK